MAPRLESSTPELDAAELAWWREFSEVEERFCWVQTPEIQRILRGGYLREIMRLVAPGARIAELGCGTGWLAILLARLGARSVAGMDFSPEQIEKARRNAREAGVGGRISFSLLGAAGSESAPEKFDLIVVHALLHHLAAGEIRELAAKARGLLAPGGSLAVVEPIWHPSSAPTAKARRLLKLARGLQTLPLSWLGTGLRRFGKRERAFRAVIDRRAVGAWPRGPSPKEMPFAPGELDALLGPHFRAVNRRKCMAMSHLIAQEILLMELSHPLAGALAKWPLLFMARLADRSLLRLDPPPPELWVFEMTEYRLAGEVNLLS